MVKNRKTNDFYFTLQKSCLHLLFYLTKQLTVLEVIIHLSSCLSYSRLIKITRDYSNLLPFLFIVNNEVLQTLLIKYLVLL